MGEHISVSIEEIKKDNPRLCLSPSRYLGKCYLCEHYINKKGIKCESRKENPEGEKLVKRKAEIKEQMKKLKTELEGLN